MRQTEMMPLELKVLSNHIYELQKGVRQMVLFTCPKQYEDCAKKRLCSQNMDFVLQPAGKNNLNFYIGRPRRILSSVRCLAMTSVHNVNAIVNVVKKEIHKSIRPLVGAVYAALFSLVIQRCLP